jgi:hypothetical protein
MNILGVIDRNTKMIDMHSEPYMSEDMYQWRVSSNLTCLAHIDIANAETCDVLLR